MHCDLKSCFINPDEGLSRYFKSVPDMHMGQVVMQMFRDSLMWLMRRDQRVATEIEYPVDRGKRWFNDQGSLILGIESNREHGLRQLLTHTALRSSVCLRNALERGPPLRVTIIGASSTFVKPYPCLCRVLAKLLKNQWLMSRSPPVPGP